MKLRRLPSVLKQVGSEVGMLRGEGREEVFHGGSFFGEDALPLVNSSNGVGMIN